MMAHRVCPFWIGYLLLLPVRKLWQNPERIVSPYVHEGMTVLDIGSAMGYFSIPLARMVGARGQVVCVDMQEKMLAVLRKRAAKAGVSDRIETHLCSQNSLELQEFTESIDFALAFAVVHEVPDSRKLFQEIAAALKPRARFLVSEPRGHVKDKDFVNTLCIAGQSGFQVAGEPQIARSHAALLQRL
jgi:ubiquinone/menaquinone biosynthesis C-methylase UbiE